MNVQSKTLRVLGIIGGVLFSILLVLSLLLSFVIPAVPSMVNPESMISLVKEMDIADELAENETIQDILREQNIDEDVLDELVETDFFEAVVEKYTKEMIASVKDGDNVNFNEKTIRRLADKHMDDLVDVVQDHMLPGESATDEEIRDAIRDITDEYGKEFVAILPTDDDFEDMLGDSAPIASLLFNNSLHIALYVCSALIAALVFVCLLHKFRGVLCLGIDTLVTSFLLLTVCVFIALLTENGAFDFWDADEDYARILTPILALLAQKTLLPTVVYAVIGLLLVGGYILVTMLIAKKQAASEPAPVVATPAPVVTAPAQARATDDATDTNA